jgi:hypothetical protein
MDRAHAYTVCNDTTHPQETAQRVTISLVDRFFAAEIIGTLPSQSIILFSFMIQIGQPSTVSLTLFPPS